MTTTTDRLMMVEWTDATNIGEWMDLSELREWATEKHGANVRNVGFLVYEDEECIVLAARKATEMEPKQIGLFERIPKAIITHQWMLSVGSGGPL
jgi:hypothetical protein